MSKRIETEEQYQKALSWLVKTAQKLEDPLCDMSDDQKAKTMAIYDRTSDLIRQYNRAELVKKYPGIREVYEKLGWNYNQPAQVKKEETMQEVPEKKEPVKSLSGWLD